MESNLTPKEIVKQRDKARLIVSELQTDVHALQVHMNALMENVLKAMDLGVKLAPEPEPPTEAERIRKRIQVVRELDCEFSASGQGGRSRAGGYDSPMVNNFRMHVRYLLNALEQDGCEKPTEPEPPTKGERIRDCIKVIRTTNDHSLHLHQKDGAHDWVAFRSSVWDLIRILEQDNCNV